MKNKKLNTIPLFSDMMNFKNYFSDIALSSKGEVSENSIRLQTYQQHLQDLKNNLSQLTEQQQKEFCQTFSFEKIDQILFGEMLPELKKMNLPTFSLFILNADFDKISMQDKIEIFINYLEKSKDLKRLKDFNVHLDDFLKEPVFKEKLLKMLEQEGSKYNKDYLFSLSSGPLTSFLIDFYNKNPNHDPNQIIFKQTLLNNISFIKNDLYNKNHSNYDFFKSNKDILDVNNPVFLEKNTPLKYLKNEEIKQVISMFKDFLIDYKPIRDIKLTDENKAVFKILSFYGHSNGHYISVLTDSDYFKENMEFLIEDKKHHPNDSLLKNSKNLLNVIEVFSERITLLYQSIYDNKLNDAYKSEFLKVKNEISEDFSLYIKLLEAYDVNKNSNYKFLKDFLPNDFKIYKKSDDITNLSYQIGIHPQSLNLLTEYLEQRYGFNPSNNSPETFYLKEIKILREEMCHKIDEYAPSKNDGLTLGVKQHTEPVILKRKPK